MSRTFARLFSCFASPDRSSGTEFPRAASALELGPENGEELRMSSFDGAAIDIEKCRALVLH